MDAPGEPSSFPSALPYPPWCEIKGVEGTWGSRTNSKLHHHPSWEQGGVLQCGDARQETLMSEEKWACIHFPVAHSFVAKHTWADAYPASRARLALCQGQDAAKHHLCGCPTGSRLVCQHRGGSAAKSSVPACAGDGGELERCEFSHAPRQVGEIRVEAKHYNRRGPCGWAGLGFPVPL